MSASRRASCAAVEQQLLLFAELAQLPIADQRVRHLAERLPDRLLVGDRASSRRASASATCDRVRPAVKIGCAAPAAAVQIALVPVNSAVSAVLSKPPEPVSAICGKYGGPGDADLRVGRDQLLLGALDVRPPLEQRRRQTRRARPAACG